MLIPLSTRGTKNNLSSSGTFLPRYLHPGKGKTRKAYLWAYRSNDLEPGPRIIIFDYQAGRSGQHAQNFLKNWQDHLLVDDYGGYKPLF